MSSSYSIFVPAQDLRKFSTDAPPAVVGAIILITPTVHQDIAQTVHDIRSSRHQRLDLWVACDLLTEAPPSVKALHAAGADPEGIYAVLAAEASRCGEHTVHGCSTWITVTDNGWRWMADHVDGVYQSRAYPASALDAVGGEAAQPKTTHVAVFIEGGAVTYACADRAVEISFVDYDVEDYEVDQLVPVDQDNGQLALAHLTRHTTCDPETATRIARIDLPK